MILNNLQKNIQFGLSCYKHRYSFKVEKSNKQELKNTKTNNRLEYKNKLNPILPVWAQKIVFIQNGELKTLDELGEISGHGPRITFTPFSEVNKITFEDKLQDLSKQNDFNYKQINNSYLLSYIDHRTQKERENIKMQIENIIVDYEKKLKSNN